MSMDQIRRAYDVPAKRGARVRYTGEAEPIKGTITGTRSGRLRVQLDGRKYAGLFHPRWQLEYLPADSKGAH